MPRVAQSRPGVVYNWVSAAKEVGPTVSASLGEGQKTVTVNSRDSRDTANGVPYGTPDGRSHITNEPGWSNPLVYGPPLRLRQHTTGDPISGMPD